MAKYEDKIKKMIASLEEGSISYEEFTIFLKVLTEILDDLRSKITNSTDELAKSTTLTSSLNKDLDKKIAFLSGLVDKVKIKKGDKGDKGERGEQGLPGRDGIDGKDGRDGVDGKNGEDGNIKDLSPEEVRDLLELLQGDDRLDKSAIKGLDEELKRLSAIKGGFSGGIVGRDIIKDIDISGDLDGVTKTFNIPTVWNIISVHLSSFPHALRKTTDFTYTPTSITFTSEIDAATSLATGQTCVLTVVTG